MTHTPGPWEVIDGTTQYDYFRIVSKDGVHIGWVNKQHSQIERSRADADLIAAAPELFRELERIEWIMDSESYYGCCPWCNKYENEGHATDCTRQAVIDKVKKLE